MNGDLRGPSLKLEFERLKLGTSLVPGVLAPSPSARYLPRLRCIIDLGRPSYRSKVIALRTGEVEGESVICNALPPKYDLPIDGAVLCW